MSSSKKYRRSKKSKKLPKKSKSVTSNSEPHQPPAGLSAEPQGPAVFIDDGDESGFRKLFPYYFRPASIKFRKKRTSAISNTAANHRRSKSLPSIPIADEIYEAYPLGKLKKLTTIHNIEDVEVIDYRCDNNSEDELLQLWYEESHIETPAYHSEDEIKPKLKSFTFADTGGDKVWLAETIAEPYASDTTLRDQLTRPYFDAEYESFKRQHWIQVSHKKATYLPPDSNIVFKVLTKNCPRNILTRLRLGYCVTYTRPCLFGETCQNHCSSCGICRHQYNCSCRKNKRFGWCWHMHAAIMKVGCAFKEELTVYVANSSRYMQLAHIRASCYDSQQNVHQMGENLFHVYENSSSVERVDFIHIVQRLADQQRCQCLPYKRCPECDICGHMYSCNCVEYEKGNLCEHCHLVAMYLSGCAQDNEKGEFCYLSDFSDEADEEDEQIPGNEAMDGEQRCRVLMMHERSNSISLQRIEAFLEPPDNMLCYSVYQTRVEEPWFIEYNGLHSCDCRNLAEAVVCPFCHLCHHEMKCYCSPRDGYCCKHLHAIKRFLKVQFNANVDDRFGDEMERKDPDWLLLEARQECASKRRSRRNRSSLQIQNIDLTWTDKKKDATENVTQNQSTSLEPVVIGGSSTEDISQDRSNSSKMALQNEACLLENGSKTDKKESIGRSDTSEHVAASVEIQPQVPVSVSEKTVEKSNSESKIPEAAENLTARHDSLNTSTVVSSENDVSNENIAEQELSKVQPAVHSCTSVRLSEEDAEANSTLKKDMNKKKYWKYLPKKTASEKSEPESSVPFAAESAGSSHKNPELTDFFDGNSATKKESKFSSAPESSQQPDNGSTLKDVDSKVVPPKKNMSELQASPKSNTTSSNENILEEKLAIPKVATFDDLKQDVQFDSVPTVKPDGSICKEREFLQDTCEDGLAVVAEEHGGMESQSTKDIKLESEIIKINEPKIDPRTTKACSNCVNVSTQTDPVKGITVSTQTGDIDSVDETTSNAGTAMKSKKRRKTKTQRKQLKQSLGNSGLPHTSSGDFTRSKD